MSTPQPPQAAKLVIGVFLRDKGLIGPVAEALEAGFGPLEAASVWLPFWGTDYYQEEMGTPLFRRMFSFVEPLPQDRLAQVKIATNRIEQTFVRGQRRRVNIDPGYLLPERFVLATGKNFTHRIYIGQGIYADLTLIFSHGRFRSLPWTYPDYAEQRMQRFLGDVRQRLTYDRKQGRAS